MISPVVRDVWALSESLKELGFAAVQSRLRNARTAAVLVEIENKVYIIPCGPLGGGEYAARELRAIERLSPAERQALRDSSIYTVRATHELLECFGVRFAKK